MNGNIKDLICAVLGIIFISIIMALPIILIGGL